MAGEPRSADGPTAVAVSQPDAEASGAAAITRVADQVLPALIGRLAASELGELEVAQDGWRIRLRRDLEPGRANDASGSSSEVRVASAGHGGGQHGSGSRSAAAAGSSGGGVTPITGNRSSVVRRAAVSPAVGYFTPRDGLATGQAVQSGDVLGLIDVLGVTQPVVAPGDGVVGRVVASAGEAVEYGQELIRIDGIERLAES